MKSKGERSVGKLCIKGLRFLGIRAMNKMKKTLFILCLDYLFFFPPRFAQMQSM